MELQEKITNEEENNVKQVHLPLLCSKKLPFSHASPPKRLSMPTFTFEIIEELNQEAHHSDECSGNSSVDVQESPTRVIHDDNSLQSTTDQCLSKEEPLSVNAQITTATPIEIRQLMNQQDSSDCCAQKSSIVTLQEECKNWVLDSDEALTPGFKSPDRLYEVVRHHSMTEQRQKEPPSVVTKRVAEALSTNHQSPYLRT